MLLSREWECALQLLEYVVVMMPMVSLIMEKSPSVAFEVTEKDDAEF